MDLIIFSVNAFNKFFSFKHRKKLILPRLKKKNPDKDCFGLSDEESLPEDKKKNSQKIWKKMQLVREKLNEDFSFVEKFVKLMNDQKLSTDIDIKKLEENAELSNHFQEQLRKMLIFFFPMIKKNFGVLKTAEQDKELNYYLEKISSIQPCFWKILEERTITQEEIIKDFAKKWQDEFETRISTLHTNLVGFRLKILKFKQDQLAQKEIEPQEEWKEKKKKIEILQKDLGELAEKKAKSEIDPPIEMMEKLEISDKSPEEKKN